MYCFWTCFIQVDKKDVLLQTTVQKLLFNKNESIDVGNFNIYLYAPANTDLCGSSAVFLCKLNYIRMTKGFTFSERAVTFKNNISASAVIH